MRLLCLDPGQYETGYVGLDLSLGPKAKPISHGIERNEKLAEFLLKTNAVDKVASEKIMPFQSASASLYDTAEWMGEFRRCAKVREIPWIEMTRNDVKVALCGKTSGINDQYIKEAIAIFYNVPILKGGKLGGILLGIVKHEIAALGVGVTYIKTFGVE